MTLRERVRQFKVNEMIDAVERLGSVCRAAKELGIHRNAIYRELRLSGSKLTISKLRAQRKLKFSATNSQHS